MGTRDRSLLKNREFATMVSCACDIHRPINHTCMEQSHNDSRCQRRTDQRLDAGPGREGRPRFVERNVAVGANAPEKQFNAAVRRNLFFVLYQNNRQVKRGRRRGRQARRAAATPCGARTRSHSSCSSSALPSRMFTFLGLRHTQWHGKGGGAVTACNQVARALTRT